MRGPYRDQTPGGSPDADQEDEYPKPFIEQRLGDGPACRIFLQQPQQNSHQRDHGHQLDQPVNAPGIGFGSILAWISLG